jgi:butyryl-CoA dehydrogenase
MKNGKAFMIFLAELDKTIAEAKAAGFADESAALAGAVEKLKSVTGALTGIALKGDIELFLADATLYLEFFGLIAIAWQWLVQALAAKKALAGASAADADFYQGKLATARYFMTYELPKTEGLAATLIKASGVTVKTKTAWFED